MDTPQTPRDLPPVTAAAAAQLEAMLELQQQMKHLHATLEYLHLMLKLGVRAR